MASRLNPSRFVQTLALCAALYVIAAPKCDAATEVAGNVAEPSKMNQVAEEISELPEKYSQLIVWGLDFSPDDQQLAVGTDDYNVNIWDWKNKHVVRKLLRPSGTGTGLTTNPLRFAPEGHLLAMCLGRSDDPAFVRIWDVSDWSIKRDFPAQVPGFCAALAFLPREPGLLCVVNNPSPGDNVFLYKGSAWSGTSLSLPEFHPASVAISPDGALAAVSGQLVVRPTDISDKIERIKKTYFESKIYILELPSLKVLHVLTTEAVGPTAWSADSARFAVAGGQRIEIFDLHSATPLVNEFVANSGSLNVLFTPDNRYFVESDLNGMGKGLGVKIWDSSRRRLLQHIPGDIGSIAISRDSKYLAVGMTGRTTVWQFKDAK